MKFTKTTGLIAAPFTPMNNDFSVNYDVIPKYYDMLVNNNVVGAFICGSSGEGVALTVEEKKEIARRWAACNQGNSEFRLIMMAGGTCIFDILELAALAEELGFYGVALTSPFYYKPNRIDELTELCINVGKSIPRTALYYYHIPAFTGVHFPMIELTKQLNNVLENFAGIKYTHDDYADYLSCLTFENGKYDMLWGRDESLLSALAIGAQAAVGSTYNYAAPIYYRIIDAYNNDAMDQAVQYQQDAVNMISLLGKYGGISTGKSFMKLIGLNCGPFRPPVYNMSPEEFAAFKKDTTVVGFGNFQSMVPEFC